MTTSKGSIARNVNPKYQGSADHNDHSLHAQPVDTLPPLGGIQPKRNTPFINRERSGGIFTASMTPTIHKPKVPCASWLRGVRQTRKDAIEHGSCCALKSGIRSTIGPPTLNHVSTAPPFSDHEGNDLGKGVLQICVDGDRGITITQV